jgi:glycosyltransferase involved in cell wall biosynthesis
MRADGAKSILISVVIPTTRRPLLLRRALASVLDQTHSALEVIIVVEGPNPETIATLAEVRDARVRVIQNDEPLGAGRARNQGAALSKGEWLAFLDDDDEWMPEKLERQISVATGPEGSPLLSCRTRAVTPRGIYTWPRKPYDGRIPLDEYLFDRRSVFRGETDIATSSLLVSKKIFDQTGFGTTPQREDTTLLLRITKEAGFPLVMLPDILAVQYQEEGRESLGSSYSWKEMLDWLDSMQHLVTKRAYSGFCLIYLGSQAARHHDYRGIFTLLGRSFQRGRPRPFQILAFVSFWILPIEFRRGIRGLVNSTVGAVNRRNGNPVLER